MTDFRPRLRPNRKNKITRKENLLIVVCESQEEADRIERSVVYAMRSTDLPTEAEVAPLALPAV